MHGNVVAGANESSRRRIFRSPGAYVKMMLKLSEHYKCNKKNHP